MRLDHLLSKENRVFVLSPGWVLVSTRLVASFCFRVKTGIARISCVWFGISETRMSVFVFGFVLLCGMLLGV